MMQLSDQISSASPPEEIMLNTTGNDIDEFRNQVYSTAYSMFTVFGLVGNCFALFILIKTYKQRTAFHIYMLNLAISDLLFICTLPFRVAYYVKRGNWLFGDFFCRFSSYSFYVNLYCSIFILTAMSFSRFLAIVHPVRNLRFLSVTRAKWACIGIWGFVTLTSAPFLMSGSEFDSTTNRTKCFELSQNNTSVNKVLILNYISLTFGFIAPFIVILVCYTMIIRTLMKNSMNKQKASRKKAIRMIIIVLIVFFISFIPYHIQRTLHLHAVKNGSAKQIVHQKKVVICLALAASNCCLDPLLYFFAGENFRRRLSTMRKQSLSSMPRD
ncbi:PREDICTED: cysteinyl leukotriene receptor 1 [Nanorana parkeri]|uniref:cysteinyl leukotriene receptor 1 n=1 Tax=Nanorana parkeri TaxID=125878 RepID=UPI0008547198|nr:PREDICTED: cysteinyl leukotriene receptor 1 [Nanorana parkeri]